jgi:hypothetical protein
MKPAIEEARREFLIKIMIYKATDLITNWLGIKYCGVFTPCKNC